ncbi:MAG: transcriptional repressor LexA [Anaerotruncus sp.]|jgi:repressor LexA|nr:transcriptional repressor LexA [Anaerotruncus sp.]
MQELTQKEKAILEVIGNSINRGMAPSVREICIQLDIKSTSTVHRYLNSLQEKGYIQREGKLNRAIRLPNSSVSRIPLMGMVTAGQPILAAESIEDYLPIPHCEDANEMFALRVRGESMIKVGILDQDILIVRRSKTAANGEIVIAMIDDEATVKRFYKEDGRYRLQPENDTMEPIYTDHVELLGKVVGLHRRYE